MYYEINEDEYTNKHDVTDKILGLQECGRANSSSDKEVYPKSTDTKNTKNTTSINTEYNKAFTSINTEYNQVFTNTI